MQLFPNAKLKKILQIKNIKLINLDYKSELYG